MKKTRRITMVLLTALALIFIGCTKPDDPNNGGNSGGNGGGNNGGGNNGGNNTINHEYVDLGLPSGNLWATCNIGAETPEDYGDVFAWGETSPKTCDYYFEPNNYKYYDNGYTKYCQLPDYGSNGFADRLMILQPEDDAASVNWGDEWFTPSLEDWGELYSVPHERIVLGYANEGLLFTGSNGQKLYLMGRGYMTNHLYPINPSQVFSIETYQGSVNHPTETSNRLGGLAVRPVRKTNSTPNVSGGGLGVIDNHEYVDLGLPSGNLWATCNIGASAPEANGNYYSWAETSPKESYRWETYKYSYYGSNERIYLTKYCLDSEFGYHGFVDNIQTLEPLDDAAVVNWGGGWRTPSVEDWLELCQNCYSGHATLNNVNGYYFVARNGQTLFLPFAGQYYYNDVYCLTNQGDYWLNTLNDNFYHGEACVINDHDVNIYGYGNVERSNGLPVRPVHSAN